MLAVFDKAGKITASYITEYIESQVTLIKDRVRLFCFLALGIYFGSTALTLIFFPETFNPAEIPAWFILIAGSTLVIFLSGAARTIWTAKINAYIFTILLLALLTKISLFYPSYAEDTALAYLFLLFLVSFTIPWLPWEIIPITSLHVAAYGFFYWYSKKHLPVPGDYNFEDFLTVVFMLAFAAVLCLVIRRKETVRDLQNFVLLREVEKKNEQMSQELELATRVHRTLIPKSISTNLVDVAVMYLPMQYIGGDYAKFHFVDDKRMIFIICDVTGHGVSAALLVNRIHTEFEDLAKEGKSPGVVLKELNDFILRDFQDIDMYLSAFCCTLDFVDMKMSYSNHGHPGQYIYRVTESDIERLDPQSGLLGLPFMASETTQHEINFSPRDKILLFTDGVIESRNKDGIEFGRERLEKFVKNNHYLEVNAFNQKLTGELQVFNSGKFGDDIFVISIDVKK